MAKNMILPCYSLQITIPEEINVRKGIFEISKDELFLRRTLCILNHLYLRVILGDNLQGTVFYNFNIGTFELTIHTEKTSKDPIGLKDFLSSMCNDEVDVKKMELKEERIKGYFQESFAHNYTSRIWRVSDGVYSLEIDFQGHGEPTETEESILNSVIESISLNQQNYS